MPVKRGRMFFMNPGPTNIPDRVLRAMDRPALDFAQAEFKAIALECFAGLKRVFRTEQIMVVYAASGHGAWESALVNVCSPGDTVLVPETGHFSLSWSEMVRHYGVEIETVPGDWRKGVDPAAVEERLKADKDHKIRAVLQVHNETSTGVAHPVAAVRKAIDAAKHPALYLVDTISSLGSFDFRMDDWGVDVAVGGSQKGLMLPPGMCFTGISRKALAASQSATLPREYWNWRRMLDGERQVRFAGTAPVHHIFGLQESLKMIEEEGLDAIFARHARLGEATRRCVAAWSKGGGPELFCTNPELVSNSVTAIQVPDGHDANKLRDVCLERFNVSLGGGLNRLNGKVFRIGHMGDLNEPMLMGALSAVEMGFGVAGIPHGAGGVNAAMEYLKAA
ncbi:MAG: aminotransferase class V-fold PLP-dependent enzyme [Alphaproteobacteria bacterium]|nr:aminotransferase class V-fold PLP-dependent enzyme [Alphaproteobacteria bacterium]